MTFPITTYNRRSLTILTSTGRVDQVVGIEEGEETIVEKGHQKGKIGETDGEVDRETKKSLLDQFTRAKSKTYLISVSLCNLKVENGKKG